MPADPSIDSVFSGKDPQAQPTYRFLMRALGAFGQVHESPKQTSIHLEKTSGFAGVRPRKSYFNLEFRADYTIDHPRTTIPVSCGRRSYRPDGGERTVKTSLESDVYQKRLDWLNDV